MKKWCPLQFLLLIPFLLSSQASRQYSRQPPGKIILTPHNRSDSHPQQVHISLAGRDHMRITWITNDKHAPSIVEYGEVSGKHDCSATGHHTSYHYFFYISGKIHHVKIGPLESATTYFYRCSGAEPEFTFRTPPSSFPIEFAVAGDLGQTEWSASTLAHIQRSNYDILLSPGDLSYADGQQPLWDSFGRFIEPHASRRAWMVTEGNHEIEAFPIIYPYGFKAYNSRWLMPYQESGSDSNLFYSFEVAGAHIIMLGSYADFDANSAQYAWLKADLANVDRVTTPWLIVILHAPWYNSNIAHQGEAERMRNAMEEILYKARVDVVFAGHVHAYERFTRVHNKKEDPCGPVYVTIGDGGNREGLALMFEKPSPSISLFQEASFGHGQLRIMNQTHAHWSWHRNDDVDLYVADEVWLQTLSASKICKQSLSPPPRFYREEL